MPRARYCIGMLRHWPGLVIHESEVAAPFQSISGLNSSAPRVGVSREIRAVRRYSSQWPGQIRTGEMGSSGKRIRDLIINIMPVHCRRSRVQPMMAAKHRAHGANCRHVVSPRPRRRPLRPMGPVGRCSAILEHRQQVVR